MYRNWNSVFGCLVLKSLTKNEGVGGDIGIVTLKMNFRQKTGRKYQGVKQLKFRRSRSG